MNLTNALLVLILLVCCFAAYEIHAACEEVKRAAEWHQAFLLTCREIAEKVDGLLERKPWRPFGEEPLPPAENRGGES